MVDLRGEEINAVMDMLQIAHTDQQDYLRDGGMYDDYEADDLRGKAETFRLVSQAALKLGQTSMADHFSELAANMDDEATQKEANG